MTDPNEERGPPDSLIATVVQDEAAPTRKISLQSLLHVAVLAIGVCVLIASLRAAASVLAPVVAALFIALIAAAPVPWLSRRMPRAAAALCVALGFAVLATGLWVMIPRWANELGGLYEAHADRLAALPATGRRIAGEYGVELPQSLHAGRWIFDASGSALRLVVGAISTLVFVGFIIGEMWGLRRKLTTALGARSTGLAVVERVTANIQGYFVLKTLASLATGTLSGLACAALGLPLPVLWAVLAFALNYIPTIGSAVAAILPVLLAVLTLGWERAILLLGTYAAINACIGGYLEPKLLGDRVGMSPLVVLMSLAFWGWVWGAIGLLLAIPLTVATKVVMEQTPELRPFALLLSSAKDLRRAERRSQLVTAVAAGAEARADASGMLGCSATAPPRRG